jgi:hypothetical protein
MDSTLGRICANSSALNVLVGAGHVSGAGQIPDGL